MLLRSKLSASRGKQPLIQTGKEGDRNLSGCVPCQASETPETKGLCAGTQLMSRPPARRSETSFSLLRALLLQDLLQSRFGRTETHDDQEEASQGTSTGNVTA